MDDPTQVTVNLTARSIAALSEAELRTGMSRTDLLNRGAHVVAELVEAGSREGITRVVVLKDWDDRPLYLLCWRQPFVRATRKWWQLW